MIEEIEKLVKSRERITNHGEVYTPKKIVNEMLDLVKQETERIDSRFLEPACGTGNFLVEVLNRKLTVIAKRYKKSQLEFEFYSVIAVANIYGIDLLPDNVEECRTRLFNAFEDSYIKYFKKSCKEKCSEIIKYILNKNIIAGDALTMKLVDSYKPIVFSEWTGLSENKIKRRDFMFSFLLNNSFQLSLFSDENNPAFIPEPIRDFPIKYFLNLNDGD